MAKKGRLPRFTELVTDPDEKEFADGMIEGRKASPGLCGAGKSRTGSDDKSPDESPDKSLAESQGPNQ